MAEMTTSPTKDGRLADIVRRIKSATADREDVVVDFKEADRARLELLAEAMRPVIDDVPRDADQFDFALSSGVQPRFWIDAVAHVHMGQDRRTYRFVRDTRPGRIVLAESGDSGAMAEHVARYIGERLYERERFLAGDLEEVRAFYARKDAAAVGDAPQADDGKAGDAGEAAEGRGESGAAVVGALWFILGFVAGAGILAAAFWPEIAPVVRVFLGRP